MVKKIARIILIPAFIILLPTISGAKTLIGVIMTADAPYYVEMHEALVKTLKEQLPAEEEVDFILQRPFPDPIAWSNAARKLIAIEVDIIVSYGAPATQAVLYEKSKIPVVYVGVYEPEAVKLEGNSYTGCGYRVPLSSLLRYFRRVKDDMSKLLVIYSSNEEDSVRQMQELVKLAKEQNVELGRMDIRSHDDLRKLKEVGRDDGVYITGSGLAHIWIEDILTELWEKRVPSVDILPDVKELGVLITLYHPPELQGQKGAEIVAHLIAGEKIDTIPPVLLRTTELVFNQNEARKMGITFPLQVIVEATRVIK